MLTNELAAGYNLAIAPDGALVAYNRAMPLFGGLGPIILWDLQKSLTQNVTNAITADEDTASLTISLDGKWLASGNYSGQVHVWELGTRQRVANFQAHGGLVYGLAFSPDGKLLATGGNDQLIHFWETGTWQNRGTLRGHNSEIWALAFSSDGQEGHSLIASALRFSPDGKLLASGGTEGDIRLWRVDAGKPLFDAPLKGHRSGVIHVAFSPDGRTLASTSDADQTIRLWSLATGQDMLLLRDVTVTSANLSSFADPCYSSQAEWNPADKWLVWQERKRVIRVTPLPTLREIDAIEKGRTRER